MVFEACCLCFISKRPDSLKQARITNALQYLTMAAVLLVRSFFLVLPVPNRIHIRKGCNTPVGGGSTGFDQNAEAWKTSASTAAALAFNISVRSPPQIMAGLPD
jgi:hypothetical protein